MNASNLTAAVATEHSRQLIREADEYRRSTSNRKPQSRRSRFSALVKDLVAASL
jgi:hypothetical protein